MTSTLTVEQLEQLWDGYLQGQSVSQMARLPRPRSRPPRRSGPAGRISWFTRLSGDFSMAGPIWAGAACVASSEPYRLEV